MTYLLALVIAILGVAAAAQTASPSGEGIAEAEEAPRESPPYRMLAPGLLGREVFVARDGGTGLSVGVWGFLLGPGQASDEVRLEGDLILLVRSGRGLITLDGRNEELAIGISHSVPAGMPFRIENFDDAAPLSLRGVLLRDAR